MFSKRDSFLGLVVLLGVWASALMAQQSPERLIDLTATGARIFAASQGQRLAPPSTSATAAVETFLRGQNRPQQTINTLVLVSESANPRTGVTHARFRQVVNGLDVYGAYVKATLNGRRELVHFIEVLPDLPPQISGSTLSPLGALQVAASSLYPGRSFDFRQTGQNGNATEFSSGDAFFYKNPTSTRVILPLAGAAMQEGWLVETWTASDNQLHHSVVGNGARILHSELRTASEKYKVFEEHPPIPLGGQDIGATQVIKDGPATGAALPSPNGWVSSDGVTSGKQWQFRLSGNNVHAYLDRDANNSPDAAGNEITNGEFTVTADLAQAPTTAVNQQVAIQNLFWANNVIHDKLYTHGFNEASGNFQQNNFNKGGAGNDSVNAEAQDGGGTNNANFATPSDGSSPRMQMYLWTLTTPNRDGDVDTDIVYHEYGHGLTWRMIGGMSGCMSGAIGEGASDTLSILMNKDDVVGEYSYNNANGIRRYPYTDYPLTYNDLSGSSVHNNGELFAAIMWKAKDAIPDDLWTYFVDGMNYIPSGPRYEDMRDGMVQSATNAGNGHQCALWSAFAHFGVGAGASGSCSAKGPFSTSWNVTESLTVPSECNGGGGNTPPTAAFTHSCTGLSCTFNGSGSVDPDGSIASYSWSFGDGGTATGATSSHTYAASGTYSVILTVTDNGGATDTETQSVTVTAPSGGITLAATGYKVQGLQKADLTWSGATSGTVTITRSGTSAASYPTGNDGFHTDNIDRRGGGSYTYEVCESDNTTCSNQVTIVF